MCACWGLCLICGGLYKALDEAGYGSRIMIDLGLVHEMDYYTGVMFRGYIGGAGCGDPVGRAV